MEKMEGEIQKNGKPFYGFLLPDLESANKIVITDADEVTFPGIFELREAIANDKADTMREILDAFPQDLHERLLNKHEKVYENQEFNMWRCEDILEQLSAEKPLFLSIVYQSWSCFNKLLDMGANRFLLDKRRNNILHILLYSDHEENIEEIHQVYDMILGHVRTKRQRRRLLLHKSKDGLNPLELAAKLNNEKMFKALIYTEGVYREVRARKGKMVKALFRFPVGDNDGSSFLWQLTWATDHNDAPKKVDVIANIPAIHNLVNRKFWKMIPFILPWFAIRFAYLFFLSLNEYMTSTNYREDVCGDGTHTFNTTFPHWLAQIGREKIKASAYTEATYATFYSHFCIIFDVLELLFILKTLKISKAFLLRKPEGNYLVNTNFYRCTAFGMALLLMIYKYEFMAKNKGASDFDTQTTLCAMVLILLAFNFFYFIQLIQFANLGSFIIGFQRMLMTMAQFALLEFFIICIFAVLFAYVRQYLCKPGEWICQDEPIYSTFLIMLNMYEVIPATGECDGTGDLLLKLLHPIFIFIVAVLTINYLIAIMSSTYSCFCDQTQTLLLLHRLHISLVLERRLDVLRSILSKFSYFGPDFLSRSQYDEVEVTELDQNFGMKNSELMKEVTKDESDSSDRDDETVGVVNEDFERSQCDLGGKSGGADDEGDGGSLYDFV